jgi:predicted secreted acid phosphatase
MAVAPSVLPRTLMDAFRTAASAPGAKFGIWVTLSPWPASWVAFFWSSAIASCSALFAVASSGATATITLNVFALVPYTQILPLFEVVSTLQAPNVTPASFEASSAVTSWAGSIDVGTAVPPDASAEGELAIAGDGLVAGEGEAAMDGLEAAADGETAAEGDGAVDPEAPGDELHAARMTRHDASVRNVGTRDILSLLGPGPSAIDRSESPPRGCHFTTRSLWGGAWPCASIGIAMFAALAPPFVVREGTKQRICVVAHQVGRRTMAAAAPRPPVKRRMLMRRVVLFGSRRLASLVLVLATLSLVGAGAAVAGGALSLPSFTPKSANQITNIDILRSQIKNYYGAPNAVSGSGMAATWNAALNTKSNYARETCSVAKDGGNWLKAKAGKSANQAIVLDVDDTTLTTWNYELFSNWDYVPSTNAVFVGLTGTDFTGNMFPATPCMLDLVDQAKAMGYAVFWITGRGDAQHQVTIANLVNDSAAGFTDITSVTYSGKTVPEIDAGYPMPTAIDTGHGGFADGLFTKPSVGSYPAYLDQPQFCGAAIAAGSSCGTIAYKSGTRAYIESQGYDIVASFGDQFSDLKGGYADRTFKMPNPNYYLP